MRRYCQDIRIGVEGSNDVRRIDVGKIDDVGAVLANESGCNSDCGIANREVFFYKDALRKLIEKWKVIPP